jgi:hypothetical protein
MRLSTRSLSALALALGACNDPTDLGKERVIGRIDPSHTGVPVIVTPREVEAQARFGVVVNTFGTFGCSSPDGQDVSEDGALIRIDQRGLAGRQTEFSRGRRGREVT